MTVENRKYDDFLGFDYVEDTVRESPRKHTADVAMDNRIRIGGSAYFLYRRIDNEQELFTKAASLVFIPAVGFCKILIGLGTEDRRGRHRFFRSSSLAASQAIPLSGFSFIASSRESSSCL